MLQPLRGGQVRLLEHVVRVHAAVQTAGPCGNRPSATAGPDAARRVRPRPPGRRSSSGSPSVRWADLLVHGEFHSKVYGKRSLHSTAEPPFSSRSARAARIPWILSETGKIRVENRCRLCTSAETPAGALIGSSRFVASFARTGTPEDRTLASAATSRRFVQVGGSICSQSGQRSDQGPCRQLPLRAGAETSVVFRFLERTRLSRSERRQHDSC